MKELIASLLLFISAETNYNTDLPMPNIVQMDQKDLEEILREGCALLLPNANAATNNEVFQTIESRSKQATLEHTRWKFELWNSDVSQHVGS